MQRAAAGASGAGQRGVRLLFPAVVNSPVNQVLEETIRNLIEAGIPGAQVEVSGDGTHFEAIVVTDAFEGRSRVQQHQLVYGALGGMVGREIHALSLQTYTPEQWNKARQLRVI